MFQRPKNQPTINKLIDELRHHDIPNAAGIRQLLEKTKDFLAQTSPNFSHEKYSDKRIAIALAQAGSALTSFEKDVSNEGREAYEYCKTAIVERLNELKESDDKFFIHYTNSENPLKTAIERESKSADHGLK